ncbi:MAG TPA: sigma-70 family RNA polymerase sigma factor [Ignavibacteria bacterium]|nr:sigma-70 family RNA polymerase sigma factor [Ignavibacteria bacterium]
MTGNLINNDTDDIILIDEFKNGNINAYNTLVRKYQKKIYGLIRKMVLDHDDASDITQEVFIKLYSSLKDFRGESKFFTYIYRIAVNYSINHLNRKNRITSRSADLETESYHLSSNETGADENFDFKLKSELLEEAIGYLPEQQRVVFNLRYYENLSYDEISQITNKSVGGMKANYFHAVKKIQEFFKKKNL